VPTTQSGVSGGKAKLKLKNNPVFLINKIVKPT
jgi:hypothetical protein